MPTTEQLWEHLPYGAEGGIQTESDALPRVTHTADNVPLDVIWNEVAQIIAVWNEHRSALSSVLSYYHTNSADAIPQSQAIESFEVATEMGEPTALRPPNEYLLLGYTFEDYDRAARFTWKALRAMTQEQIRATLNYALEADNRLVNGTILQRLFDPTQDENENATPVYGLYNGDSFVPPSYLGKSFTAPHNHYLVSSGTEVDSGDLENLAKNVSEHGFGSEPSSQLLLLCNPEQAEVIASFRAGEQNNNSALAKHDFVPSQGAPAFYAPQEIVGDRAPADYNKLKVQGSYGNLWIVSDDLIPAKYLACVASYGANSSANAIGVREHPQPQYRGFRSIPGPVNGYPLIESFYTRAFGIGVRRRGQAAVTQIKATGTYDIPEIAT